VALFQKYTCKSRYAEFTAVAVTAVAVTAVAVTAVAVTAVTVTAAAHSCTLHRFKFKFLLVGSLDW
jgi:hypothetical protein